MAGSRLPEQSGTFIETENEDPSPLRPNVRKKPTKGRNNLRKSLAWNEAFFTDEGVLDVDELQIVAKTPKKPLQFPSIEIPEFSRPPIVPGNSTVFPGARAGQPSVQAQEFKVGLLEEEGCFDVPDMKLGDHLDLEENLLESDVNPVYKQVPMLCVSPAESNLLLKDISNEVHQAPSEQPFRPCSQPTSSTSNFILTVENESSDAIEKMIQKPEQSMTGTPLQKGTRLRLPGTFAKDATVERDVDAFSRLPPLPTKGKLQRSQSAMVLPTSSTSLSQRVSSISKKVKSALGKVIPGRSENQKKLKGGPELPSSKRPIATLSSGPIEASSKLTSAHASSPFSRSGRMIMPESSNMLTKQNSASAMLNGSDKSAKLAAASSPFNRSGRNILPEASIMATRQQSRTNVSKGPSDVSAKLASGYAPSPFNRSGRNILPEAVPTRQQTGSLGANGRNTEASAKVTASSPFSRSGRNILAEVPCVTNRQQTASSPSTRASDASAKPSTMQASSLFSHPGRSILTEAPKVPSGQLKGAVAAPNVPGQGSATLNLSSSNSPCKQSGKNFVLESSTVLSRSASLRSNSTSNACGAKSNHSGVSMTRYGGPKVSSSPTAPVATAPSASKSTAASQVAARVRTHSTKPSANVGAQSKPGQSSRQVSSNRNNSAAQEQEVNTSSSAMSASLSKPSGLRWPAPKLGFFQSARVYGPSVPPDKSLGVDPNAKHAAVGKGNLPQRAPELTGRSRLPNAPSERPGTDSLAATLRVRVLSNIPAPPHLRGSESSSIYRGTSASAPASPKRSFSRTRAAGADQTGQGLGKASVWIETETPLGACLDASSEDGFRSRGGTPPTHKDADVCMSPEVHMEGPAAEEQWNCGSVFATGCPAEAPGQDPCTADVTLAGSSCTIEPRISNSGEGEAAIRQPPLETKLLDSCEGTVGLGLSRGGESVESPSHWPDWLKFKERTPDSQKIQSSRGEGAKSLSPAQLLPSDSSPTSSSSADGPRLVRCTSSPMVLNGRSPLGPLANPIPKRRESRSFFSLARKAVNKLTSSPRLGQENDSGDKLTAATSKGRRLSKAGQTTQRSVENSSQRLSESLTEGGVQEGVEIQSNAAIPDVKKFSPYTEEWIAALEAAGQEALEMKGGSVQNSPPQKTGSSKSNPWSPVRRTAGLGPFDCTKRCS